MRFFGALADGIAVVHLACILVLVGGAVVVAARPRWWKFHLPFLVVMGAIFATGSDCPLTTWEAELRHRAGWPPHRSGFVAHYLVDWWHPAGITTAVRLAIIAIAVVPNVVAYTRVLARAGHRPRAHA